GVFAWTKLDGKPTAVRPWIANAARGMGAKAEEEKSGVYGSFLEQLSIYRSEVLRKHINESTVSFQELANRPRPGMVYLNVPAMRLDHLRPYIRMVTRAALRELTESTNNIDGREVRGNLRSTLIVLDEVASLKHVEELATASGFLRGHGVILMMFWQSYSQLTRLYGENESISETVDVHIFGRPKTFKAAKLISDALGSFSTVVTKRNKSGHRLRPGPLGHLTEQADISTRPLLTPSEVMRIPQGNNIIISRGLKINANKFRYFENAQLDARARLGAVARSDVMHTKPLFFQRLEEQLGREQFARLLVPTPETPQKPRRTLAKRTKRVRVAVAAEGSLIAQYAAAIEAVPNA
ncbi:MAG: type IV secretory system conjugative DNA transfer family protein, partial [Candidatus Dormibacteria bacterium]